MVSIITATYQRPNPLRAARASIDHQTYAEWEHIVVSDGPSTDTAVDYSLAFNHADWGATPRLVGSYFANGDLIAFLDDDNAFLPDHLVSLVDLLTSTGSDFVFSDDNRHIGNGRPEFGHIDTSTILCRRDLLMRENWRPAGYAADWDLVERWLKLGATWAYSGKATLVYRCA